MSTVKVNELSTYSGTDISIETGKTVAGTASQFKMTDVVQGDVLYGSAADTLSRLPAGTSGQVLQTQGAGANPVWAADAGLFSSYAIIADQKTQNTAGGTFTSGAWRTRDLNTEVSDPDGIVSISSNEFTLAAGSYLIRWFCPTFEGTGSVYQTRLYNVTDTSVDGTGMSVNAQTAGVHYGIARVSPSGSKAYRIEHQCDNTEATNGFGKPANFGTEQYTTVEIFKES